MLHPQSPKLKFPFSFSPFFRFSVFPILIFFIFLIITSSSCGKEERLYGIWRLQTAYMNGDTINDSLQFNVIPKYTRYTFSVANTLVVETSIMGKSVTSPDGFYAFKKKSAINMRFTLLYKHYNIDATIKKLTSKELLLEYEDDGNEYLLEFYSLY